MKYPVGKTRFEPLGFIIFACVMATTSLMIVKEGGMNIINGIIDRYITKTNTKAETELYNPYFWVGAGVMGLLLLLFFYNCIWLTIGVFVQYCFFSKAYTAIHKLVLFLVCWRIKHSAAVQAYAYDHRNDVISNTLLVGCLLLSGLLPLYVWWTDDFGAAVLSIYIIVNWIQNSWQHVKKLVGTSASPEILQKLTLTTYNYHPKIEKIETVNAFYIGQGLYVEVDVVVDPEMKIREAHDIGEGLQKEIEKLPDVERAYIHLDHDYSHSRGDEHKEIV